MLLGRFPTLRWHAASCLSCGGSGGCGMIPFCCSFSPQNPVGTRLVQMSEQGVAVNMKAVGAY